MSVAAARVFPLSPDGSAAGLQLTGEGVVLSDLTAQARFGIKGPGSSGWLERHVGPLPAINQVLTCGALRILRLGGEDFLVTGEDSKVLAETWRAAEGPRGYWSWREEGWAWLRLEGAAAGDVMSRLCAIDLRAGRFASDGLAQTRVAHVEAIVAPVEDGFDLFFDIATTTFMVKSIASAAERAAEAVSKATPLASRV